MPLGFVGMTTEFALDLERARNPLAHGFTASAHPVACSVASATLRIMAEERLVERARNLGEYLLRQLADLVARRVELARARGLGMLAVVDLDPSASALGRDLLETLVESRLLIRDYADATTFCFGPAFTATADEIDEMVARFEAALDAARERRSASAVPRGALAG